MDCHNVLRSKRYIRKGRFRCVKAFELAWYWETVAGLPYFASRYAKRRPEGRLSVKKKLFFCLLTLIALDQFQDVIPVNDLLEHFFEMLFAQVLVIEVIGMLPDIQTENRGFVIFPGVVAIGG